MQWAVQSYWLIFRRIYGFNALTVADVIVKQDEEGRYCLNDLHKAAGGAERLSPNRFTRTDTCVELITELTPEMAFAPMRSVRGGTQPGTFVCKELVYAYAMWISPAFHLKVIRAYDELQTQGVAFSESAVEQVASGELDEDALMLKAVDILQRKLARLQSERDGVVSQSSN